VEAEQAGAMAEISDAIVAGILTMPELSDPDWDTYSLVADVSDNSVAVTAYRYAGSGPPVPVEGPDDDRFMDLFWDLRDATRGVDGQAWDVVLVKIHRDTAQLVMNFVTGDGAELWRVRPENMAALPESLRPRPEDFAADRPRPGTSHPTGRVTTATPVVVELHADGGIGLTTPTAGSGLASLKATCDWIDEANRHGDPVRLTGDVTAALAVPVADEVRRRAASLDETPSAPAPWPRGHSSVQAAAFSGLTDQLADLLDRGASPDVGRGAGTPYRLAMQRGHAGALSLLGNAGAPRPRGLAPPATLPNAVVLRAYAPRWLWWLLVPFVALAGVVVVGGAPAVAPGLIAIPLLAIAAVHIVLANTRCAIDGPLVARRRGRGWQGPVDLRELDALGFSPPGPARSPVIWVLGQRHAGDAPNVYSKRTFGRDQLAVLERIPGLRFVPIYAARGFLSPGFEHLLARYVDRTSIVVGAEARERVWPEPAPSS
jgi:hypothetical protein